jgi:hypothetical protein
MSDLGFESTPRRGFLGRLAAGAVALAAGGLATASARAEAPERSRANSPWDDTWMTKIKGKHRQLFDTMEINNGFPLLMTYIWYVTNKEAYNLPENALSSVLVIRHGALPIGLTDAIWSKYALGEMFNVTDPVTSKPATRNIFASASSFVLPPFADAAVDKSVARGTIICACNVAIKVHSSRAAEKAGVTPEVAMQEWISGLLPGVTRVPSGVLAVGRAQEHGCVYTNVT